MSDIDALERRKRELELRRDIAKLERNERLTNKAAEFAETTSGLAADVSAKAKRKVVGWSWLSVSIFTLIGAFLVLGGLHDGALGIAVVGALFFLPFYFKIK
jgi:hypothetical protein